jgi:putative component of membrane protein insertase Oxa1/YidC/SpoIIIJ protein YidD
VTAAALALAAIRCYQRFISPYKGYSCALRVATGGASCSAYGYAVIARFGLGRGLGLLLRRFELCGHVHMRAHAPAPQHPRMKYQRGSCDLPCHGQCASADVFNALGCASDAADCCRAMPTRGWRGARKRNQERLDAAAERIARREATKREERRR